MRPFFSYYGAKYTAAKYLGAPRHETVVEPFAGSAAYSVRWAPKRAKLYDVSADICALWDFLIHCSPADIDRLPDEFEHIEQVMALPLGPQMLCRFWVAKGRAEPSGALSPWYRAYRNAQDCRVWSAPVKRRIVEQKPRIAEWTVDQCSWDRVPQDTAHWHVDPPYDNAAGRRYPNAKVEYAALAAWCRALPGEVDVCENEGADWLPFSPLCEVVTSRGRRSGAVSREVVWRKHDWT